jgi:hypothetical protein
MTMAKKDSQKPTDKGAMGPIKSTAKRVTARIAQDRLSKPTTEVRLATVNMVAVRYAGILKPARKAYATAAKLAITAAATGVGTRGARELPERASNRQTHAVRNRAMTANIVTCIPEIENRFSLD